MKTRLLLVALVICSACLASCAQKPTPLVVFAAGSLILPFEQLEKAFEAQHPEIDVLGEYHGSIQVMRHVTELHESIDIVATADQSLIPMLMYQVNIPETEDPYATWYISMATNRLGIAYRPESKYAGEITADNWWEILSRPDVRVGLSDPRFDAVGYRALMILALAQDYYGQGGIFGNAVHGQFRYPIHYTDLGDRYLIRIPEILETTEDAHIAVRGSSVGLIALLEAGEVDYAFEYESVIRQHGFEYLALPDALSLGEPGYDDVYGRVTVEMDFQRFATVNPIFRGEQIRYGITIPTNAPHPEEAAQFIAFLFSPEGQAIMQGNEQPLYIPPPVDRPENLPAGLRGILELSPP
jgi:molybdate/tungstate transport system substrate-binding protein